MSNNYHWPAVDREYARLIELCRKWGFDRPDRTGVGTRGVVGASIRVPVVGPFPILGLKKVHWKSVVEELLWFISGSTDVKELQARGVTIWDEWATPEQCARFGREAGDLGPVYGHQWRNFGATRQGESYANDGVDQLKNVIEGIKRDPFGRRHIVTGWNPKEATQVALPPCHTLFQFHVQAVDDADPAGSRILSCTVYQRSADLFLGVPFNIASYALLTLMVAKEVDLMPGYLTISFGDLHIYKNHDAQSEEVLSRTTFSPKLDHAPVVDLVNWPSFFNAKSENIVLSGYDPLPSIKAPVAV